MAVNPEQAEVLNVDVNKLSFSLFRRHDQFKIGEDFDLFVKKCNLYAICLQRQQKPWQNKQQKS